MVWRANPPLTSIREILAYTLRFRNKLKREYKKPSAYRTIEKNKVKKDEETINDLKLGCIVVHIAVAIYFFPTEKRALAFGLLIGHIIGALKPEKDNPRYDFLIFILQGGASLYLGSIYDKVFNIALLLWNHPKEFAEGIGWVKTKFSKPKETSDDTGTE